MRTKRTIGTAPGAFFDDRGDRGGRRRQGTAGDDPAWRELKALVTRRIADCLSGAVSAKSFDTIVEEELRQV